MISRLLVILSHLTVLCFCETSKETEIRSELLLEYDRLLAPRSSNSSGAPLVVSVDVYVSSMGPFDEAEKTLTLGGFIRATWKDKRLAFENESVSTLQLPGSSRHDIWLPDLYFPKAKSFDIKSDVQENSFARIFRDGTVLMSVAAQMELDCPLDLRTFPFDWQQCSMVIESYGYTADDLVLEWKGPDGVQLAAQLPMKQFIVLGSETFHYSVQTSTGTYSSLEVKFPLARTLLYQVYNLFFPATCIVFVSWIPLWAPRSALTLRFGIGVSALLSMLVVCNMGNAVKHGSSALTLADTYILYCFIFVLGSLIATICQSLCCNCSRNDNQNKENDGDSNFVFSQTKNFKKSSICDKIVGTVFPAVFVLLLVIYYIFGFN